MLPKLWLQFHGNMKSDIDYREKAFVIPGVVCCKNAQFTSLLFTVLTFFIKTCWNMMFQQFSWSLCPLFWNLPFIFVYVTVKGPSMRKFQKYWGFSRQGNLTHFCQIIWHIWSYTAQKKIIKNCPQWSLDPLPPAHQSHALPTELGRNLLEISEMSFLLFHALLHILEFVYF